VVSGINYGENVATGITISGTIGAAMEAASLGIPAMAISLETAKHDHLSYSKDVNFAVAAYFTGFFARLLLQNRLPLGMEFIKVDVPSNATFETAWQWTRLSQQRYYIPIKPKRTSWSTPGSVGYDMGVDLEREPEDTDVYTLLRKRLVSVTPLTLDLTARVEPKNLDLFAR
jgi:5'-nucleotidase